MQGRTAGPQDIARVVALFRTLDHPTRASIVHRLTRSPADVTELTTMLGLSQPLVSHHLRLLREGHLVQAERDGRRTTYRLVDDHVASILLDALGHTQEHDHDCHH